MFSKIIVCAFFVFSAAVACASPVEFDLAVAEAYAEYERDVSQALALAKIRLKAEMSPTGHFDFSGSLLALAVCTMFLAANAAQVVLSRFGMGMTRRDFSLFMVLTVLYLNVTVSSAELLNVSEVEFEIDALYAKFQAKWELESAKISMMELELVEASAELERVRQLEVFVIENQIENLRQWPEAHKAWSVSVIIAQLVLCASVALVVVRWFARCFNLIVCVMYYLLVGIFCMINCGLMVFMIYLVFYHEQKPY